jgi:tape measure domain-containing protein
MADPIVLGITIRADGSAEVRRELGHVRDDLNGAGHAAQGVNRQFADMASMVKNLASAYISFDLAKSFVKNVEQVQNMKVQLIGLTNGAQDYANVENYLSELSQRHHKDNLALSDSFSKLLAIEQAGLITRQQSRALLEGMSNIQSKTGASADQMTQSMFGLSQALGAGILHMEELNQVTEPVPGLLNEIAKAAGFTGESAVGDFRAMVADGKITSDMFGNIMVNALSRYQGAAEAAGNTLTAQYADIKNAWTGLVKDLQEPVNDVLTPILKFARDQLDGIAQDIREIKALAADFKAIEANGMRPPGYVKPAKTSAASSAGQVKSTANAASIKRLIEESEGWYSEIVIDEERKRYQALDEAKKRSTALAKQQAEDAIRDAKRKSEAVAKGVSDEMAALKDHYNQLTMTARAYYETTLYAKGFSQAQVEAQLKEWDKVKAKEKEKELDEKYRSEMDAQIDKYKQLTLSAKEYYAEKLKAAGLNPEQIKSTLSVFGTNTEIEAAKKQTDDARSALDEYANSLNSVKKEMSGLGSVSSAVFDGALGGVNALTGAFSNMVGALQENTQALSTLREKQSLNELDKENKNYQKNIATFAKEEARLRQANIDASIDGVMQIAGASSQMFEKNSEEARAMNFIVLGGLAAKAAAAMLTQGTGDPYTAFARIAAMGTLVAGIMSAAGAGGFDFSGGGSSTPAPTGSSSTGTVLGDSEAKSASVNNTYELLQDIHAKEYATLRSIDQGIYNLKSGITDVITRLFQAGGINVPTIDGRAKYAVDMQALNLTIGGPLGHMVEFAKKLPVIGGLISGIEDFVIGGLFGKTTRSVTGSGIGSNPTSLMDIMNGGDIAGYQYAIIETKKKSWFSTKKSYSEQQMALDEATQDALTRVFKGMGQTMYGLAEQLGHDTKQKVEAYVIPAMKVELHGLSGEDAAKKLNDVISASLDTMSDAVFGEILGQYQQLGEGMLETTTRIVSEIAIVQDALHQSGVSLTGDVVAISDAIVQAAGGLKEFQGAFEQAFDKFASDGAKLQRRIESLQGQLLELFPQSTIDRSR